MTWAPTETQRALFIVLAADPQLIGLLGEDPSTVFESTRIRDFVPDNQEFPYVTMDVKPWEDRGNSTYEGWDAEIQINVWWQPGTSSNTGRGDLPVQNIQKRIDKLLHDKTIDVEGWNTLQLRRTVVDILTEDDNVTKHGIQRFNLLLGGN